MERASLEQLLGQGLSLAEIGRRFGRHESTVGYWVEKHGLEAVGRRKYAARGGVARDELETLVAEGMSIAQIAERVGLSKTTVRHWLREWGLNTHWADRRRRRAAHAPNVDTTGASRHSTSIISFRRKSGSPCPIEA